MNGQIKYIIQGASLALLVVVVIILVPYFSPSKTVSIQEEQFVIQKPILHTTHVIKNVEGQKLFRKNCSACHSLFINDAMLSISKVENHIKDSVLLREWIHYSSKVLRSGNPYFNGLVKEYNGVLMPDFPNLSDHQINEIIDYMKEVEEYK